jgi:hypothetical protein
MAQSSRPKWWKNHPLAVAYAALVGVATVAAAGVIAQMDPNRPGLVGRSFEQALDAVPFMLAYQLLLAPPLVAWCVSGRFRRAVRAAPLVAYLVILDAGLFLAAGAFLVVVVVGFVGVGPTIRGG